MLNKINVNDNINFENFIDRLPCIIKKLYLNDYKNRCCDSNILQSCGSWIDYVGIWSRTKNEKLWHALYINFYNESDYRVELTVVLKDFNLKYSLLAVDYICRNEIYDELLKYFKNNGFTFNEEDVEISYILHEGIDKDEE